MPLLTLGSAGIHQSFTELEGFATCIASSNLFKEEDRSIATPEFFGITQGEKTLNLLSLTSGLEEH